MLTPGPYEIVESNPTIAVKGLAYEVITKHGPDGGPWCAGMFYSEADANLHVAAYDLLHALEGMNHMGGDERGGYCICPVNDGSAPDIRHATSCENARQAIRKATKREKHA